MASTSSTNYWRGGAPSCSGGGPSTSGSVIVPAGAQQQTCSGAVNCFSPASLDDAVLSTPSAGQPGGGFPVVSGTMASVSPSKATLSFWTISQQLRNQLLLLMSVVISEAFTTGAPLPFVGLLVAHLSHVPVNAAGYTSGFLVAAYFLGQILSGPFWGRLGDHYGRKPMLQVGLLFAASLSMVFGFCGAVWQTIAIRFLQGVANGNLVLAKAAVADLTDHTTEHVGFGAFNLFWGVGSVFGPMIGGWLFDPMGIVEACTQQQQLTNSKALGIAHDAVILPPCAAVQRASSPLLAEHPALAASVCITLVALGACLLITVGFRESNRRSIRAMSAVWTHCAAAHESDPTALQVVMDPGACHKRGSSASPPTKIEVELTVDDGVGCDSHMITLPKKASLRVTFLSAFRAPETRWPLLLYMCIAAPENGMMELFPLWAIASRRVGGLELSSHEIGSVMMVTSVACVLATATFDRVVVWAANERWLWNASIAAWLVSVVAVPWTSTLEAAEGDGRGVGALVVVILVMLSALREVGLSFSFGLSFMCTARCAPKDQQGALIGITQSCGALARMTYLLILPPLFSWSLESHEVVAVGGHHLAFWVVVVPLAATYFLTSRVKFQ